MSRTVLLTGATGFIGGKLAARLWARGDKLRCVVRSEERGRQLQATLNAEIVVCALTEDSVMASAMRDCDLAYHLAAIYDVGVVDTGQLEEANVEGTESFLKAAHASGIPRAVYVSSTVALGPAELADPPRTREYDGPYPSVYHRTKAHAHRLARQAQERGQAVIIACPAFVYGPGDNGPGGRFLTDLLRGRVPALLSDPAWFSYVHVDDVVTGLEAIGDRGRIGATYVLSGEARSMNEFAAQVAELAGIGLPRLRIPARWAALTGRGLDQVARVTGWRFPITREGVETTARAHWLHTHAPTTAELGWHPRDLRAGLADTVGSLGAKLSTRDQRTNTASSQNQ